MNVKTKSQLRAEAVERLRQFDANERIGKARLVLSMLGWTEEYDVTKSVYEMRAALIDLLTDERETDVSESIMIYAKRNRPSVNTTRKIITEKGVIDFSEVSFYD